MKQLGSSTIQRVNAGFVSEEFARREADIIWKLAYRGGPIYLFVLIEFQSSVDTWMALRFLRYLAEFYQSLVAEGQSAPFQRSFNPQLSYYAIPVNEIPEETLLRIHNAVSAVFYVETGDPHKLAETLLPSNLPNHDDLGVSHEVPVSLR